MQADLIVDLVALGWGHVGACWVALARAHIILMLSSTLLVRIFRLWYLFFGAQERLRIFRDDTEGGAIQDTKEINTRIHVWFSKRPYFAKPWFLWTAIVLVTLIDAIVVNSVFFGDHGATCGERVASLGPYYFVRGGESFAFCAWKTNVVLLQQRVCHVKEEDVLVDKVSKSLSLTEVSGQDICRPNHDKAVACHLPSNYTCVRYMAQSRRKSF